MQTTTLGAFPKPSYVPVTDWFSNSDGDYTSRYLEQIDAAGDEADALFDQAVREVVNDQVEVGIDIPTDGEIRRENYIHYLCRQLDGIDFARLSTVRLRGTTTCLVPTITGPIGAGPSFTSGGASNDLAVPVLVRDYVLAQAASDRPIKITVPGPMTIIDSIADDYYHDDVTLGRDLAKALNQHILALAAAGCRHIQVDEPVMARKPQVALDHGIQNLGACFTNVPDSVTWTSHACCGYPNRLDEEDYVKADQSAYLDVAEAIDASPIDALSIEDAHRHNDLAELLPRFQQTTIIFGVIGIAQSKIESVDSIESRLRQAVRYLPHDQIIAAPDCGLGYLGRDLALSKLANMVEAAAKVTP